MTTNDIISINEMLTTLVMQERETFRTAETAYANKHPDYRELPDDLRDMRRKLWKHEAALKAFREHEWN